MEKSGFKFTQDFFYLWLKTYKAIYGRFIEMPTMGPMREKYEKEMKRFSTPEAYKDFYKKWVETYSETFKEFLKSDDFYSDIGKFMSYLMEFQKNNCDMLEENYLRPLNLPTRTEIDEINREVYTLKKTVKQQGNQIKELSVSR